MSTKALIYTILYHIVWLIQLYMSTKATYIHT